MYDFARRFVSLTLALLAAVLVPALVPVAALATPTLQESAFWQAEVDAGDLPPVAERVPEQPFIVDLARKGRTLARRAGR